MNGIECRNDTIFDVRRLTGQFNYLIRVHHQCESDMFPSARDHDGGMFCQTFNQSEINNLLPCAICDLHRIVEFGLIHCILVLQMCSSRCAVCMQCHAYGWMRIQLQLELPNSRFLNSTLIDTTF